MQEYVRRRLSGAEQPPAPTPDPMKGYVLAQMGVPDWRTGPDRMTDSPVFLQGSDTGTETTPEISSNEELAKPATRQSWRQRTSELVGQMQEISRQMNSFTDPSDPRFMALSDQFMNLHKQFQEQQQIWQADTGRWAKGLVQQNTYPAEDADIMQRAIEERQNQPRQPLTPPAPGGVPLNAPIAPSTRDFMS